MTAHCVLYMHSSITEIEMVVINASLADKREGFIQYKSRYLKKIVQRSVFDHLVFIYSHKL